MDTVFIAAILLAAICQFPQTVNGDRILVLSPVTSPSHSNFIRPIVEELAARGHHVTYWNGLPHHPHGVESQRFKRFYSEEIGRINRDHGIRFEDTDSAVRLFFDLPQRMRTYCTAIYRDPIYRQLSKMAAGSFDVIVADGTFNECVLPLVAILDAPLIYLTSMFPAPWLLDAIGLSMALDHVPHPLSNMADRMNLLERTWNTLTGWMTSYLHRRIVIPAVDRLALEKHRNNTQIKMASVKDIEDKYLSLMITNTHFSVNYQMPMPPAVVEVGGLHCRPGRPLPPNLKSIADLPGGFVVVSFGSILKGAAMPDNIRRVFLNTFGRFGDLNFIWKWEGAMGDDKESIPANVHLFPWLPQQDLLADPNIRLFINHGGYMSHQEAIYHGVPFVALPVFGDQPISAQKAHDDGYAIRLHWNRLSESVLYDAMAAILSNGSSAANSSGSSWPSPSPYVQRMNRISNLMADQMDRPLDRAVYWIEYVIRHQGAPHLRTASRQLSLMQRCLFDVSLIFFTIFVVIAWVLYRICRKAVTFVQKTKLKMDSTKKCN